MFTFHLVGHADNYTLNSHWFNITTDPTKAWAGKGAPPNNDAAPADNKTAISQSSPSTMSFSDSSQNAHRRAIGLSIGLGIGLPILALILAILYFTFARVRLRKSLRTQAVPESEEGQAELQAQAQVFQELDSSAETRIRPQDQTTSQPLRELRTDQEYTELDSRPVKNF